MTEHIHSRAKPTESELDKVRSRLAGHTNPNASGATANPDILPTSTASLAARLKPIALTPEQEATAQANIKRRQDARQAAIAAQREAAKKAAGKGSPSAVGKAAADALPPDPINGVTDETIEDFTASMTPEEKEQFKKDWAAQQVGDVIEDEDELSDDELLDRDPPQATGEG